MATHGNSRQLVARCDISRDFPCFQVQNEANNQSCLCMSTRSFIRYCKGVSDDWLRVPRWGYVTRRPLVPGVGAETTTTTAAAILLYKMAFNYSWDHTCSVLLLFTRSGGSGAGGVRWWW